MEGTSPHRPCSEFRFQCSVQTANIYSTPTHENSFSVLIGHQSLFFCVLHVNTFCSSSQQPNEVGTAIDPILQQGKLRQRNRKWIYTDSKQQSRNRTWAVWLQRPGIRQYMGDTYSLFARYFQFFEKNGKQVISLLPGFLHLIWTHIFCWISILTKNRAPAMLFPKQPLLPCRTYK